MLRKLEMKDAPYMLEWMHDPNVTVGFAKDFSSLRIEDCTRFIDESHKDRNNIHLAVVGDSDEYMGTVSLKNLNARPGWAEFAIAMRTKAMGSGLAGLAIHEIIHKGMTELCLTDIYWNVFRENQRAIRFYEKNGFRRADETVEQNILKFTGGGGTTQNCSTGYGGITFPKNKPNTISLFECTRREATICLN